MTDLFAVATPTRTVGLAVCAEAGFRLYASDHAFAGLEGNSYRQLEDIQSDARRIAVTPGTPLPAYHRGRRRSQRAR